VLGVVTYAPEPGPFQEIARPGEAEFRMLAVDPAAQGRGVGEAIVADLLERTRARGLARLVCSTQRGMQAAHRLYERCGFTREPDRDWSPAANIVLIVYGRDV
jgi:ribosomal protein S18 acetylase RimI-like enzyme